MAEITIILSTYNRREFLSAALESIVAQTFSAWRLLVINDGGDDVGDVVAAFKDTRMEYYDRPHAGKAAQMNFALDRVRSKYIVYMDDDDEALPHHLQTLYDAAERSGAEFAYSNIRQVTKTADSRVIDECILGDGPDVRSEDIRIYNRLNHAAIIHTKALAERVGRYDERMRILIDYDYIKRLLLLVRPLHVNEVTFVHYLRVQRGKDDYSSISGLWRTDPDVCGRSLLAFFEKDPGALELLYWEEFPRAVDEKRTLQDQLGKKIAEYDAKCAEYDAKRNALQDELARITALYDEVRLSTCWRMTGPLRWTLDRLKGLVRR